MAKKTEIATIDTSITSLPAFLQDRVGQSPQQLLDSEDVGIPRLKLLQPMSPEVEEFDATPGTFFSTSTHAEHTVLLVNNLGFERNYLVSGDQTKGGNRNMFIGAFPTMEQAQAAILADENADVLGVFISHRHFLRIVDTGEVVAMDFANTAVNVSKRWNMNLLQEAELPRCARFWELRATKKKNDKGFWYVPEIEAKGYVADEAMFNELVKLEESFRPQKAEQKEAA